MLASYGFGLRKFMLFSHMASVKLISVDYEVLGKVQGVFFRRDTQVEAKKLQLVGWVQNTGRKTVVGTVQGPEDKVQRMKHWLSTIGSKKSRIDKCNFSNEITLTELDYESFDIEKPTKKTSTQTPKLYSGTKQDTRTKGSKVKS